MSSCCETLPVSKPLDQEALGKNPMGIDEWVPEEQVSGDRIPYILPIVTLDKESGEMKPNKGLLACMHFMSKEELEQAREEGAKFTRHTLLRREEPGSYYYMEGVLGLNMEGLVDKKELLYARDTKLEDTNGKKIKMTLLSRFSDLKLDLDEDLEKK